MGRESIRLRAAAALLLGAFLALPGGCGPGSSDVAGIGASAHLALPRPGVTSTTPGDGSSGTNSLAPVFNRRVLGRSVDGRPIEAFSAGTGARRVVVIGGIHGDETGGEVARDFLVYLEQHLEALPTGVVLEIIPTVNLDGAPESARAAGVRVF